jgi:hypothetical protein
MGMEEYLDLQHIVSANALVVHFVISVIRIASILILNKSEAMRGQHVPKI